MNKLYLKDNFNGIRTERFKFLVYIFLVHSCQEFNAWSIKLSIKKDALQNTIKIYLQKFITHEILLKDVSYIAQKFVYKVTRVANNNSLNIVLPRSEVDLLTFCQLNLRELVLKFLFLPLL